ncbi:TRAP transporter large permease [Acuticoccus mangrovi]|uniref:TRAP transporter large permease protein n=1 Tax=Acuticoccus mangrovi TaxID=2796142 RepID=A0A934MHW9_9HYPH|nr:TRAP transporter large permease subunit [Acuticoccus mangrovi]MBJ3777340.1 TRAP transporter large permease subunit [Acuticoccus mangrovi]
MSETDSMAVAMMATFILLLFTGFPVAWLLGGVAFLFTILSIVLDTYFDTWIGVDMSFLSLIVDRIWGLMNNWVMVALPMFVFMGFMLDRSGAAEQLLHNISRVFGRVRGGMALSVTIVGIVLAASTGIVGASVVLLATLSVPTMMKSGYDRRIIAGTVCSVGTLGILIPPSIMLVLMADQLALPVGDLFRGALLPGLMLGGLYAVYLIVTGILAPQRYPAVDGNDKFSLAAALDILRAVVPPALLIVAVLGSIFAGIATPTEASGVGAFGATVLAACNRKLTWGTFWSVCTATTRMTAFIFGVLIGATAFSLVLRGLGGDELIEGLLKSLPFEGSGVVIAILAIVFILGFFLEYIEITLIVLPLVAPIVSDLGYDLVWFTILFSICLQTSFLTPPVGFALFYFRSAASREFSVSDIYRGVIPFILMQLLVLALAFNFTALVL